MDLWDISKDVFDSLIQDISAKAAVNYEEEEEEVEEKKENVAEDENLILKVLPFELLGHIFQFLPNSDLYTVRLVCKEFNEVATSPQVFKLYLKESYFDVKEIDVEAAQPILKNIVSINIYNTKEEDYEVLDKVFKKLEEECTSLKILKISYGLIGSNITIENIVERLEQLVIMNVEFKNAPYFFKTSSENPVYRNLEVFEIFGCTGIEGEPPPFEGFSMAPMRKLREICLNDVQVIGDREYLHLKESMANVTSLVLSNTTLNVETFLQLDLKKVTNLNVTQSQSSNDWLSALKNLYELEVLIMSAVSITDTCSMATFKKLNKIKTLTMLDCNFGNRTVSAVASYLPNLVSWEMMPSEDGNVTDTALNYLVVHNHLETIMFDRVQFGGFSLRQIARYAPALKNLTLTICAAGDDDMDVFVDHFTCLKKLNIFGMRITDVGLGKLEPRLGLLEEIQIESRFITGSGMAAILPKLTSAVCLDFKFGEPQSWFSYTRSADDNYNSMYLSGPEITKEIMMSFTTELYNAIVLRLESVTLDIEIMRHFVETQPRTNNLTINTSTLDDETAAVILKDFKDLGTLYIYQCRVTMNGFVKLFEGIESREIGVINIENENMFDEETFLSVASNLKTVTDLNVHTFDYAQYFSITNNIDCKDILFQGLTHMKDEMFSTIMKSHYEVTNLTLADTNVTVVGIATIAEHLTKLNYFRIKSKVIDDEALVVIGKHFPSLKTLSIESELVTDTGLVALEKHFENLESLSITNSDITDEGVRKIAPLLKVATCLDLYSRNKKVTAELLAFMRETYQDISHTEPEMDEVPEGEGGEIDGEAAEPPVQPEEGDNNVDAEAVNQLERQNEAPIEIVQQAEENGPDLAVEPIQLEIQNLVIDDPVQAEELNEAVQNQVQLEVAMELQPEQNEDEMEPRTPNEQNQRVAEESESEKKNNENVERRPSEEENDVVVMEPSQPPEPQVEAHNGLEMASGESNEEAEQNLKVDL